VSEFFFKGVCLSSFAAEATADTRPSASAQPVARVRPQVQCRASDVPFLAIEWSEYLRIARTLAARIMSQRSPAPASSSAASEHLDDAALHATLARWGLNATLWLAKLQQLDRQCTRALGTAERVLRRAGEVAQQRFHGVRLCRELFAAPSSGGFT
jgi:hypothetical protein